MRSYRPTAYACSGLCSRCKMARSANQDLTQGKPLKLLAAFVVPMLMHGTFDSLLMIPESMGEGAGLVSSVLFIVLLWFDVKMWKWGVRRIQHLQELSKQQDADRNHPFRGFTWDF